MWKGSLVDWIHGFLHFQRGLSPWSIGVELKQALPALYCPVDSRMFHPGNGPIDPATSNVRMALFDDRELAFPYFEQARAPGVPRVANFVVRQPRTFAHVIWMLLRYGGDSRIMFGSGCSAAHLGFDPVERAATLAGDDWSRRCGFVAA